MADDQVNPSGTVKSTTETEQEPVKLNSEHVLEFMENQRKMNEKLIELFETFSTRNNDDDSGGKAPLPKKSRVENDNALELHPSDNHLTRNERVEDEDDDDDAWNGFNRFEEDPNNHKGDGPHTEHEAEEHISGSQFQGLLEQSEDVLGDPIETALTDVCNKT